MQSGFGVSEIQQFMGDGSAHPFFSISSATAPPPNSAAASAVAGGHEIYHPAVIAPANKLINNTFHRQYPLPTPAQPHFPLFHSNIPVTHQLFTPPPPPHHHHHHHHHHHFQLFQTNHNDHRGLLPTSSALDHDPDPENSVSGPLLHDSSPPPSFISPDMKFKLATDDSGSREGFSNGNDVASGILHVENTSESRLRPWHSDEDCAIKEPFWRPLDLDYINSNNKRCKDKEPAELPFAKRSQVAGELDNSHPMTGGSNYKLFSELEAIYKPGSGGGGGCGEGATTTTPHATNQTTRSGSALTADDHPLLPPPPTTAFDLHCRLDDDNSTGGEVHMNASKAQLDSRRRRRRRRRRQKMASIAAFFESLLKQLIDHQEALHQRFLETMEQRDRERTAQEAAWRDQEGASARREAAVRAHDRGLAAAREAAILSFLEKIAGETINLAPEKNDDDKCGSISAAAVTTSRWPKTEVQALIQVRCGFDGQFQEPGLKAPLWEEVSSAMATMGYRRSAKRCKEKWENINKYFRKSRDSGRKRSQHSKTCPYFHQLDQLYSKTPLPRLKDVPASNSELLEAVVAAGDEREEAEEGRMGRVALEEEGEEESRPFVERLE